jgi:predicted aldo/keto reductase-like oxidoreductase
MCAAVQLQHYHFVGSYTSSGTAPVGAVGCAGVDGVPVPDGGNGAAVAAACARGMGVFIISPFDKGGRVYDPPRTLLEACAPVHPIQYASHWLWSRRAVGADGEVCNAVSTVSVGAAKASDWDEHFAAAEMYSKVDEIVPPIEAKLTALRRFVCKLCYDQ